MNVVQPKAVILYAKLGSVYYPVACAKDVQITTTSDLYELAPRSSRVFREYEYGRINAEISGSGLSVIDGGNSLYTIFDIIGTQFNSVKWLAKFSMMDYSGLYRVFECQVLVKEISISGSANAMSSYTYNLQVSGDIVLSTSYVANSNPEIKIFEHTAAGPQSSQVITTTGTTATMLVVYINGVSKKINIYPDAYGADEVQWRADNDTLYFGTNLVAGDKLKVVYIDLA